MVNMFFDHNHATATANARQCTQDPASGSIPVPRISTTPKSMYDGATKPHLSSTTAVASAPCTVWIDNVEHEAVEEDLAAAFAFDDDSD